mgnify:FL=1
MISFRHRATHDFVWERATKRLAEANRLASHLSSHGGVAHPLRLSVRHIASSLVEEIENKLGPDQDPSLVHIYHTRGLP